MKKLFLFVVLWFSQITLAQSSSNAVTKSTTIPFDTVENQPVFPGGNNELMKFVGKNFSPPSDENFTGGILQVTFVIETNGSISDIKVINDLGYGTAQEITRVLQTSPKWTPGDQDGKPVRVLFTLSVTIKV
ncbi:energy transducer TonB [Flavobacterium columnare]|uniref:energy transducer TonB n=1 Tax=Flavobacterium columnare TaxID=996 RepID=UPI002D20AE04|nr:energy transducer TonB [Flavobacterium columnare]MEB3800936.1 energy transducer TonB [Flavobacterium columnare]